ncbi:hypothetical protein MGYG_08736 [Nannizzia gypsea CBS 118893]|uniref:Transposase IS30-like HTH domain-containing protein n=1 Tax=Arthroderma gypseum (strain ATCC MYA-4604 / CBS 118893) TaxID=535722 RepID=E4V6U7_ARTGP|nr:hypothetical protein MGYG_08736 [Nannizzia gypsea CBS 118893]EFQ96813.1 hypothetical protein MGYG_08736 [Nannizzia gypsea CBS 118893]
MARHLSKESRADILRLRAQGLTYKEIAERKGITHRQVQWTCESGDPTPKRRSGRPSQLSRAQVNRLIEYVCASPENRQRSYLELATVLQLGVGQFAVRNALYNAGFRRRAAREGRRELHRVDSDAGIGVGAGVDVGGDVVISNTEMSTTTATTATITTTTETATTQVETAARAEPEFINGP